MLRIPGGSEITGEEPELVTIGYLLDEVMKKLRLVSYIIGVDYSHWPDRFSSSPDVLHALAIRRRISQGGETIGRWGGDVHLLEYKKNFIIVVVAEPE